MLEEATSTKDSDSSGSPAGLSLGSPRRGGGSARQLGRASQSTAEVLLAAVDTASSGFALLRSRLHRDVFIDPGRLRTVRALGEGAFGRTHRAELAPEGGSAPRGGSTSRARRAQPRPRDVAVKTLRKELLENAESVRRFPEPRGCGGRLLWRKKPDCTACTMLTTTLPLDVLDSGCQLQPAFGFAARRSAAAGWQSTGFDTRRWLTEPQPGLGCLACRSAAAPLQRTVHPCSADLNADLRQACMPHGAAGAAVCQGG